MSENKEKSAAELLREKLIYKTKNGFKTLDEAEIEAADAYCEGYKTYLDAAKTEREAVTAAIATGLPGILLQLFIIPQIVLIAKRLIGKYAEKA